VIVSIKNDVQCIVQKEGKETPPSDKIDTGGTTELIPVKYVRTVQTEQ